MTGDDVGGPTPLLATKLHPPTRRPGTVARPRLIERVARGRLPVLTVVAAPAGFGKTTLVAEWFAAPGDPTRRTAWLSLDPGDNDPAVFWTYLVAAVQSVAPQAAGRARSLLRASQPMSAVVASLLNDLAAVPGELVIVLDDYHVIESTDIHDGVAHLLDHLPPEAHLVLAGRADPPLPLARLRSRGGLLEIRAADLRFTTDEAATYFNQSMGLGLSTTDIGTLESRTEGWVAALQLAALSLQGRDDPTPFISSFAGDDRFVVDYLAEEVLERQPEAIREFLLETSILDRLAGPLCDAVTGRRDGKATLEQIDRANLFLVPLDDRRRWYRYHHLFADVLRARLLDERPERLDDLHRRASTWFESAGDPAAAITHALAGHDVEQAARLIELAAPALFAARQEATARRWLTSLPPELFPDRPVLSMELIGAHMVSGQTTDVVALLDGIERWLDPDADLTEAIVFDEAELAHLPAQVQVYRAALALIAGDVDGTIEHATRAIDLAAPTDHLRRGSASALVGLANWTVGDLESAGRRYTDAVANLTAAGHVSDVLGCSIALGDIQVAQGRLHDAIATFTAALELAAAHGVVRGTADMHIGLTEVHLDRNDLGPAMAHLEASDGLGEEAALPQHAYRSRVAAARMRRAEGDPVAALALLDAAERVYDTDLSPPVRPVSAVTARVQIAAGDVSAARRWAITNGLGPDDELTYVREYEHLTLARALLAEPASGRDDPSTDQAMRLLARLLDAADEGQRHGSAIEALVLRSLGHEAQGDRASAIQALERAVARATPEGNRGVFIDELPALAPLLRASDLAGAEAAFLREVLAASPDRIGPASRHRADDLVEELSSREVDVLRMLRGDQSGPEIARSLHVSLNTLRTHTRNIYRKLGVTNRREAVRRAAELDR